MTGEISFDLVMEKDMSFVEGVIRLNGGEWMVLIVKKIPVNGIEIVPASWSSGVSGIIVHMPQTVCLDKEVVEKALTDWFGVKQWSEIRGPDSMQLR